MAPRNRDPPRWPLRILRKSCRLPDPEIPAGLSSTEFSRHSIQDGQPAGPIESLSWDAVLCRTGILVRLVDPSSLRNGNVFGNRDPRRGLLLSSGAAGLTLILASGWIGLQTPEKQEAKERPFWQVGVPAAIAVHDGRATFRVPTPAATSEVLVVVSASRAAVVRLPSSSRPGPQAGRPFRRSPMTVRWVSRNE